jgi:hypothetical protein
MAQDFTVERNSSKWVLGADGYLKKTIHDNSRIMASDFTVERNSSKWVLGADGYLKEYIADAAAIEFNADGSYKGVLVEPAGTNEALQSEDLDNASYWAVLRTTIATDTETDPKGGTNSFLLSETTDNNSHNFLTAGGARPSVGSGETWTGSIFVKKGDGANAPDIIQLGLGSTTAFGGNDYANFDISVGGGTSGTVTASSGGTAGIRYYGNGWYRISWTATSTSADNGALTLIFTNNNPTATRAPSYAGQTDANVFIWGAQLEESPIATSYIPTTTIPVTRVKDDIYITGASSLIGQTEGTMFVEVDWQLTGGTDQQLLSLSDGTANNRIIIHKNVSDELRMFARANSSTVTNQGESSTAYSGIQKIAFAYKTNDFELYRNGSSISTDTSGSLASLATLTDVDFGQRFDAVLQANMWIRAVALFTTRLSDAECEELTTI